MKRSREKQNDKKNDIKNRKLNEIHMGKALSIRYPCQRGKQYFTIIINSLVYITVNLR